MKQRYQCIVDKRKNYHGSSQKRLWDNIPISEVPVMMGERTPYFLLHLSMSPNKEPMNDNKCAKLRFLGKSIP
jgi:hypothetical protein